MSLKSKGINAERELIHKFWGVGWGAVRVAGSGSMRYPSSDILAANRSNSKQLILTHFSARYKSELELGEDAKNYFFNVSCARDFLKINL